MSLKIVPTVNNTGYWVSVAGFSVFNENARIALESSSELIADKISSLQSEIRKLRALKLETDNELERLGGKYRPRRVAVPEGPLWFQECAGCHDSHHNINLVAVEVTVGSIKVFCHKCGKENFPSLIG